MCLPTAPHKGYPSSEKVAFNVDPAVLLEKAARAFGVDLERFKNSAKVSGRMCWTETSALTRSGCIGDQTNQQIADLFGLSYSAVAAAFYF